MNAMNSINDMKELRDKCKRKKDYNHYTCVKKLINCECIICLNQYDIGQSMTLLKCGHIYHKSCLESWFKKKKCSLCDILIKY